MVLWSYSEPEVRGFESGRGRMFSDTVVLSSNLVSMILNMLLVLQFVRTT